MAFELQHELFEGELLPEFTPTSTEAWHEQLEADLGANWAERLGWNAAEGVRLRPFYREEDLEDVPTGVPGTRSGWQLCHNLTSESASDAQREVRHALDGGSDALGIPSRLANTEAALRKLLADIDLSETALHLNGRPEHARWLFAEAKRRGLAPGDVRGSLVFDPTACRFRSDALDTEKAYDQLAAFAEAEDERAPAFRLITADGRPLHDAGAGPVESLALALAALSEHFAQLTERNVSVDVVASHAQVVLPVSTVFFVEVARLRAVRRLFPQLAEAYGADGEARLRVHAETAWRPVTLYDPHLNLLRGATAGAAAAVIGGTDGLAVRPFDAAQAKQSAFAKRLARNAQHILREEAHLDRVADPAAGSYYAEVLTDRLARRAWSRFQEIEAGGGLLAALRRGVVHERLAEARSGQNTAMARRDRVRVGTNHYPNLGEERLGDTPEDARPHPKRTSFGAPRETEAFERLRLATERHAREAGAQRSAAFLLPVGTPRVRSARANFARNALGCAGFRAVENVGFDSLAEGVRAAADAVRTGEAHLVACCAPDEDYVALLPALRQALAEIESGAPVIVAGQPDSLPDEAREAADAFVHQGMDLLKTLEALQERLGIEPIAHRQPHIDNRHAS